MIGKLNYLVGFFAYPFLLKQIKLVNQLNNKKLVGENVSNWIVSISHFHQNRTSYISI